MNNPQGSMSTEEVLSSIKNILIEGEAMKSASPLGVFNLTEAMIISEGKKADTKTVANKIVENLVRKEKETPNLNSEELANNILQSFRSMFGEVESFKLNEFSFSKDINTVNLEKMLESQLKEWLDNNISKILQKSISQEFERVKVKTE